MPAGAAIVALACTLTGCSVGPSYLALEPDVPAKFGTASQTGTFSGAPLTQWWRVLHDEKLNALIERAIQSNPTLEVALDRVQIARTQEAVIRGYSLPSANASFGGGRGTGSDISRSRVDRTIQSGDATSGLTPGLKQINYVYGLDAGWEADLFGRYRRALEAANADTGAALARRNGVLIAIIAEMARAYVDLRGLQQQLAVLDNNIEVAKKYVKLTNDQTQRGITNQLDLALANRQLATLQSEKAPLRAQIASQKAVIAVLTGRFPEEIGAELAASGTLPRLPHNVGKNIPYELLKRRPDVIEAERDVAAATARVGVATADLFPRVGFSYGWGVQGQGLGITPAVSSYIWSAGPAVSWAILDFGTLDNLVNAADLRSKAALSAYKAAILNAVREVDTAIANYEAQLARVRSLKEAKFAAGQAVSLSSERFERGLTDSLNVILAQRELYTIERDYAIAQQTAAEQFILLHKALGGGWEEYQDLPDLARADPAVIAAFKRGASLAHPAEGPAHSAATQ